MKLSLKGHKNLKVALKAGCRGQACSAVMEFAAGAGCGSVLMVPGHHLGSSNHYVWVSWCIKCLTESEAS